MASINIREIVLEILISIDKGEEYSHILMKNVLDKYDYLDQKDKAFISRVAKGTLERRITLDHYIDSISSTPVRKMKPLIRNLIRMSAYQILYMDRIPDSAACNEAVKLAGKRGFRSLGGFVNGVLRNLSRNKSSLSLPDKDSDPVKYLAVTYSCSEYIVGSLITDYGMEATEKMLKASLDDSRLYVRIREDIEEVRKRDILASWTEHGIEYEQSDLLPYAYVIRNAEGMQSMAGFEEGEVYAQDISSMLVAEVADPEYHHQVIDMCAAPGGKTLHMASKILKKIREVSDDSHSGRDVILKAGHINAGDITEAKVDLIRDNVSRMGTDIVTAVVRDACIYDDTLKESADIVIADVPCSGFGVIGRKPDIKFNHDAGTDEELAALQRRILDNAVKYLRKDGILIYSTCTVRKAENDSNVIYLESEHGLSQEDLRDCLPEKMIYREGSVWNEDMPGCLQLMISEETDGFYIARLRK